MRFIGTRLVLRVVPTLLLVTFLTSFMLDLTPGDPAIAILGDQATPESLAALHKELDLDKSLPIRWANWVGDVVQGDLGTSPRTHESVSSMISERLPVTAELMVLALLISFLVALPIAVLTAYRAGRRADQLATFGTSLMMSMPPFLTGVLLVYFIGLKFHLLPVSGWVPLEESLVDNLRSAILPAITLAFLETALFIRVLRADLITTLQQSYLEAARAKGMPTPYILFRHALRPSSFSLVTLLALASGRLIGGAVVVEIVFALPGMGSALVTAITARDLEPW